MKRSAALTLLTQPVIHVCPYKGQDVALHLCYRRRQDIEDLYCYGCEHPELLRRGHGLKTYNRRAVYSTCKLCGDAPSLHSNEPPYVGTRTPCPGFQLREDTTNVFVPTNTQCTEWMVVKLPTGERVTLAEYTKDKRYRLPLVGAPGVVSDARDEQREEAAKLALKRRTGSSKKTADEGEDKPNTIVKPTRGKRS